MIGACPEDQDLLEDVLTEMQQAIEVVGITSNILSGMMDAFASIIGVSALVCVSVVLLSWRRDRP